ncbi:MAG: FKBP-type peptidyl-prolyl cis-trans isomerase [Ginsengibacter sp.]
MSQNLFLLLFIFLIVAIGCKKETNNKCGYPESNVVAPTSEQEALHDSLSTYGIDATLAPSGFYYKINELGDGPSATTLCSTLAVFYRGGFFNGKGFDSSASGRPAIFQLGQVIAGWKKGLPLIKKSGDITLYIPPSLGYGSKAVTDSAGKVVIPPNSNLVFRVVLADVQ